MRLQKQECSIVRGKKRSYVIGIFVLLPILLFGCSTRQQKSAPGGNVFPSMSTTVSPEIEVKIEKAAQSYVAALAQGDYVRALQMTDSAFRARTPLTDFPKLVQSKYLPLTQTMDLRFDSSQYVSHGKRVCLRAQFTDSESKRYRTNFFLTRAGQTWQINEVLVPAVHTSPTSASGGAAPH